MLRRPRDPHDPNAIDEGTDTYDTIDWLLKNVPNNNGRVGMLGISYGGWLTVMAMLEPHPALKAVSEQASPADMFLGDDFHHNGAFRLSYGFEYATMMETGKTSFHFHFDRDDTLEWYLALGPLANVNAKYLDGRVPSWNDFVNHPNYDEFWQRQAVTPYLKKVPSRISTSRAGGTRRISTGRRRFTRRWKSTIPGTGITSSPGRGITAAGRDGAGSSLGKIEFGSDTSKYFREKIQAAWFAYWLKDEGQLPFQEAMTFRDRNQSVGDLRGVAAAAGHPAAQALFPGGRRPFL